jgi:hypothetical protein
MGGVMGGVSGRVMGGANFEHGIRQKYAEIRLKSDEGFEVHWCENS